MFDLQIYQIATKTVRPIMTSSVHRWNVFSGTKYLNCEEKMQRCHSMNFEDYNADKEFLKKTQKNENNKCYSFNGEDPTIYMLTIS